LEDAINDGKKAEISDLGYKRRPPSTMAATGEAEIKKA
jgi:hypothetical protein